MKTRRLTSIALIAALTTLTIPARAGAAEGSSPLAGARALFEQKCSACHPLERPLVKQADPQGWKAIVKSMIAKGASLNQQEADQITGYLAAKSLFETKCNGCHDLAKPLAAIKNPAEWQATVAAMAAKKPALLAQEEALAISQYLALAKRTP